MSDTRYCIETVTDYHSVVLTLPIAIGRMITMTGRNLPEVFFIVAGALLTSCGWIDALLYTLTRRILVNNELSTGHYNRTVNATLTNAARPGDHYGLTSMADKEIGATARTVTIVGGSNRLSRLSHHNRGREHKHSRRRDLDSLGEDSPTRSGSQDSIIKPMHPADGINIATETTIQVETTREHEFAKGARLSTRSASDYSNRI